MQHEVTLRVAAGDLSAEFHPLGAQLATLRLEGVAAPLTAAEPGPPAGGGEPPYHGRIVGPVANRISGAAAAIGGPRFRFPANEGPNLLHGGSDGTHARLWEVVGHAPDRIAFRLHLAAGEGGFPGNREVLASFAASAPAALTMTIAMTTDAPSVASFANHSYWSLGPAQELAVAAEAYLPVDAQKIPTGEIAPVAGTRFDFRASRPVGGLGYDHNLCLARAPGPLREVARLTAPGLAMTLSTTEPGLQVFDGFPEGIALEPQGWPDAANRPEFPPILLRPGETYRQVTRWTFSRA